MPIHVLPDEVASQIAAGEVVERPASVVKELLENALDAHAAQVTIAIEGAGRRLIEIGDDGSGIPAEELPLAVARHATSKLFRAEDLFHIQTLGFRGEALASIGSVSRMTVTTQAEGAASGSRLRVEGGRLMGIEPAGTPQGTVVRVEELFFNVPARLKFLKQDATERQQIDGLVTRYAIAYADKRFRLFEDSRPVIQTSGNGSQREVLANLYGVDIARQMLEVNAVEDELRLSGFITPISITRSNRREITFFINGRWVQDTPLTQAVLQAYHTLLMVGRYPMAVLFLDVPPETIDVNVHPAKAEVRFRNADLIFSGMQRAIRRALLAYTPVPELVPQQTAWTGGRAAVEDGWAEAPEGNGGNPTTWETGKVEEGETAPTAAPAQTQPGLPGGELPLLRLVGQIGLAYLVAEGPDGLYLIDQHAAHERVLFERFLGKRARNPNAAIPAQALLEPVTVHLPPLSAQLLNDQLPLLDRLGFEVETFGPGTYLVRAIPAMFTGGDPAGAVRVLVEDFEEDETPLQGEIEARLIARVCKRVAVKAGQTLSVEEQRALVRDLEACKSPRTCPHGRPTMIHLSVDSLERQFGRKGAR
ncbi:MAG TPA: DNA mismatch repair endonuclease MutL [Anaerolineaceae bacterium]|nr:DNA mismatch repair endonuclease MutL [Anaerolineaceae bacterium]